MPKKLSDLAEKLLALNGVDSAVGDFAVPEEKNHNSQKFVIADLILKSLEEFNLNTIQHFRQ